MNKTEFMTPSAFIFLYENNLFLTFCNRTVAAWNFRGELVTSFEDHELWHPNCNTNNIYITAGHDLIISYCKVSKQRADCVDSEAGEGTVKFHSKICDFLVILPLAIKIKPAVPFQFCPWDQLT